jgi:hypothetical protein
MEGTADINVTVLIHPAPDLTSLRISLGRHISTFAELHVEAFPNGTGTQIITSRHLSISDQANSLDLRETHSGH